MSQPLTRAYRNRYGGELLPPGEFSRRRRIIEEFGSNSNLNMDPLNTSQRAQSAPPNGAGTNASANTAGAARENANANAPLDDANIPRPLSRTATLGNLNQSRNTAITRVPTFKVPNTILKRSKMRYRSADAVSLYKQRQRERQLLNESEILNRLNTAIALSLQKKSKKSKSTKGTSKKGASARSDLFEAESSDTSSVTTIDSSTSSRSELQASKRSKRTDPQSDVNNVPNIGNILSGIVQVSRNNASVPTLTTHSITTTIPVTTSTVQTLRPLSLINPTPMNATSSPYANTGAIPKQRPATSTLWNEGTSRYGNERGAAGGGGGGDGPSRGGHGNDDGDDGDDPIDPGIDLEVISTDLDVDREPGLHQVLKHIVKPIKVVSDPNKRDKPEYRRNIDKHLQKITPSNVKSNLDHEFLHMASAIQESVEENISNVHNELYREMQKLRHEREQARLDAASAQSILERLKKLEENEKLSNRISTEKRDELKPNLSYPILPANDDNVRKARMAMINQMKINERKLNFESDPYNYILCLASESNKVAEVHLLTKDQQRDLLLANIPAMDSDNSYLSIADNLDELFKMISVLASNVLTISDLEKHINAWVCDNSTDKTMYKSITTLMDLLKRSMQNTNRDQPIKYPELFRVAIGRIQRIPNLPNFLYKSLNEGRLRIRDTDTISELNNILIGCMNPYIGYKNKNKNKQDSMGIPNNQRVFAIEYKPQKVQEPILHDSCTPPKVVKDKQKQINLKQKTDSTSGNQGSKKGFRKKAKWVEPWPEGKNYMSKSGGSLSRDCETWIRGFCFLSVVVIHIRGTFVRLILRKPSL